MSPFAFFGCVFVFCLFVVVLCFLFCCVVYFLGGGEEEGGNITLTNVFNVSSCVGVDCLGDS